MEAQCVGEERTNVALLQASKAEVRVERKTNFIRGSRLRRLKRPYTELKRLRGMGCMK